MTRPPFTTVLLALSAVALIGCGSSSSNGAKPSTHLGTVPSGTSAGVGGTLPATDSTDSTPVTTGGSACGDTVAKVTAAVTSSAVTKVEVMAGCSLLNIATSLTNDAVSTALDICDAATAVAYVGKVKGVTVVGATGKELAAGVKGTQCIGEP